jgi:hypothetical protein
MHIIITYSEQEQDGTQEKRWETDLKESQS